MLEPLVAAFGRWWTRERARLYAVSAAAALLIAWLGATAARSPGRNLDGFGKFLGNDFVAFFTGARMVGSPELYDLHAQLALQRTLTDAPLGQLSPFISPPWAIPLYWPFAQGPYLTGLALWWAFGIACAVGGARALRASRPELSALPSSSFWLTLALAPGALLWLTFGQATGVALGIWCASLALALRGRDLPAGLALALLAFKPQLALPVAIPLIAARRWRALAGGAIGLCAWGALAALALPEQSVAWFGMRGELLELLRDPTYLRGGVHSIYGAANMALAPLSTSAADLVSALASLALLGSLGALWWNAGDADDDPRRLARWAVTLALGSQLCVQLFVYDLWLLVVPLWLAAAALPERARHANLPLDGGPLLGWTALVATWSFVSLPLLEGIAGALAARGLPPVAPQIGPLLLLGWSLALWRATAQERA